MVEVEDEEEKEFRRVINAFQPRNRVQQVAKELNLVAVSKVLQKQTKELQKMTGVITEQNRFLKEHVNSPFTRFNLLTRRLIRELVCHQQYTVIGRVRVTPEPENKERIDYSVQRFQFENTNDVGLMLFAFSDEDSLDNFQAQIQGKAMETADVTPDILIKILGRMVTDKDPKHFSDGKEDVTGGIVVDPSLPSYFAISKEKFPKLPQLLMQITIETILRRVQYEQINPTWPSDLSDETVDSYFPQILDFEEFHVFLLEDSRGEESLLTITHEHAEVDRKGVYDTKRQPYLYVPVFTDDAMATDYISALEHHFADEIRHKNLSIVSMKGMAIVEWLKENEDVHGLMFNPKEAILQGQVRVPEDMAPSQHSNRSVPRTNDHALSANEYYELPDWPLLPYLCSIKRSLLFHSN